MINAYKQQRPWETEEMFITKLLGLSDKKLLAILIMELQQLNLTAMWIRHGQCDKDREEQ